MLAKEESQKLSEHSSAAQLSSENSKDILNDKMIQDISAQYSDYSPQKDNQIQKNRKLSASLFYNATIEKRRSLKEQGKMKTQEIRLLQPIEAVSKQSSNEQTITSESSSIFSEDEKQDSNNNESIFSSPADKMNDANEIKRQKRRNSNVLFNSKNQNFPLVQKSVTQYYRRSSDFKEEEQETKKSEKQLYLEKFANFIKIPCNHFRSCAFFKKDPRYIFVLGNRVFPEGEQLQHEKDLVVHYVNGKREETNFESVYRSFKNEQLYLQVLVERDGSMDDDQFETTYIKKENQIVKDAIFKISNNSQYMAILSKFGNKVEKNQWQLNIYEIQNDDDDDHDHERQINRLLKNIQRQFSYMVEENNDKNFEVSKISFAYNKDFTKCEYVILIGKTEFLAISLDKDAIESEKRFSWSTNEKYKWGEKQDGQPGKFKKRPKDFYDQILDVKMIYENKKIYASVACKVRGLKEVQIIDFSKEIEDRKNPRSIVYHQNTDEELKVIISEDINFGTVFFSNLKENYILQTKIDSENEQTKTFIKQIPNTQGQTVRAMFNNGSNDLVLALSQSYDNRIRILHSKHSSLDMNVKIKVEPGLLNIQEIIFTHSQSTLSANFKMLNCYDGGLYLNTGQFKTKKDKTGELKVDQNDFHSTNFRMEALNSLSVKWPYVCFGDFTTQNFAFIANMFDPKNQKHRIELPDSPDRICATYITITNDLFILTQKKREYLLFHICLDESYDETMEDAIARRGKKAERKKICYKVDRVFKYFVESVDSKPFLSMHVRGSSSKDIDNNLELIIYLLHDGQLYAWNELEQNLDFITGKEDEFPLAKLMKVTETISNEFVPENDGRFYLLRNQMRDSLSQEQQRVCEVQEILMIETNPSDFEIKVVHKEYIDDQEIINISQDFIQKKMLIFNKSKSYHHGHDHYIVKFKDQVSQKIILQVDVQDDNQLIGRFSSGLFKYIDGHIYFGNNVVKVRFDVQENKKRSEDYSEFQLFDKYKQIFELTENEKFISQSPYLSSAHRFFYIKRNKNQLKPHEIIIVPFLHEKRVYLNRPKKNTEYFYTSIDMKGSKKDYTDIVCLNITKGSFYIYGENGYLKNRIEIGDILQDYGSIVAVSQDGRKYLLKYNDGQEIILSIFKLIDFDFILVKEISLQGLVMSFLDGIDSNNSAKNFYIKLKREILLNEWALKSTLDNEYGFNINDHCEVSIIINRNIDAETTTDGILNIISKAFKYKRQKNIIEVPDDIENQSNQKYDQTVIYFKVYNENQDTNAITDWQLHFISRTSTCAFYSGLYFTEQKFELILTSLVDIRINNSFLILFTDKQIWHHRLDEFKSSGFRGNFDFKINSNSQESCFIKDVRQGSGDLIAIIVQQERNQSTVIIWNIQKIREKEAFDVIGQFEILWDNYGNPYIIQEERCIMTPQRVSMKCFEGVCDLEKNIKQNVNFPKISTNTGNRFDGRRHNWLILNNYLCLSFSYLSFIIKEKFKNRENDEDFFDVNAFNYIFNRSTPFLDKEYFGDNHEFLENVCRSMLNIDKEYLVQLHYSRKLKKEQQLQRKFTLDGLEKLQNIQSPLTIELESLNTKKLDVLLEYISLTSSVNTSKFYQKQICQLIEQPKFKMYLENLPIQSLSIKNIQVLKKRQGNFLFNKDALQIDNSILFIKASNCFFIERQFFEEDDANDSKGCWRGNQVKQYPVEVYALPVEWIIMDHKDRGLEFLIKILEQDSEIFEIQSIIILVEYLYKNVFGSLNLFFLGLTVLQLIIFIISIIYQEKNRKLEVVEDCENFAECQNIYQLTNDENQSLIYYKIGQVNLGLCLFQILLKLYEWLGLKQIQLIYSNGKLQTCTALSTMIIGTWFALNQTNWEGVDIQLQRKIGSLLIILYSMQILLQAKMLAVLSDIIDTIEDIVLGILWFVFFIAIFFGLSFAISSWLIAQNSVQLDDLKYEETDSERGLPQTFSFKNSLWNTLLVSLNTFDPLVYFNVKNSQNNWIVAIFMISSTFMVVVLMNMLIALMGDIFNKQQDLKQKNQIRSHLESVVFKWSFKNLVFWIKGISSSDIKYIVCAFNDSERSKGQVKALHDAVIDLKRDVKTTQINNYQNINKIHQMMNKLVLDNNNQREEILHRLNLIQERVLTENRK